MTDRGLFVVTFRPAPGVGLYDLRTLLRAARRYGFTCTRIAIALGDDAPVPTSMGGTAVVDVDGITLVLTSLRRMPFDAGQLRSLAIEPAQQRIIVIKSAVAWRAAFGDVARRAIVVDTPGICASNLARFADLRRPQPLYRLESKFTFELPPRTPSFDDALFDGALIQES
jgi:MlrC C-terminus